MLGALLQQVREALILCRGTRNEHTREGKGQSEEHHFLLLALALGGVLQLVADHQRVQLLEVVPALGERKIAEKK